MSKILLDGVWELESFIKQNDASIGMKLGIIGLGQGGGKIANTFAGLFLPHNNKPAYPVLAFNTNVGDMDLKHIDKHNKIVLKGAERGAGMDPEKGRQAIIDNGGEVFSAINRVMSDVDVIIVIGSLGGGTGTGAINLMIDVCSEHMGKPVVAITSLPYPHVDENVNAFNALRELAPKLTVKDDASGSKYRQLDGLAILDNKKIIDEHFAASEQGDPEVKNITWYQYSNYKVASILHEWNVITTLKSDKTLDPEDLKNKVFLTGGVLTFAKKKINLEQNDLKSEEDLINEVVSTYRGKNVLANGFDYANDAKAFGITVLMPKNRSDLFNADTLEKIYKRLQAELPGVPVYYGSATWDSKTLIVYTMMSLNGLPERARKLKEESEHLLHLQKEREENASGFMIDGEVLSQRTKVPSKRNTAGTVPSNPFLKEKEVTPSSNPFQKSTNPFMR